MEFFIWSPYRWLIVNLHQTRMQPEGPNYARKLKYQSRFCYLGAICYYPLVCQHPTWSDRFTWKFLDLALVCPSQLKFITPWVLLVRAYVRSTFCHTSYTPPFYITSLLVHTNCTNYISFEPVVYRFPSDGGVLIFCPFALIPHLIIDTFKRSPDFLNGSVFDTNHCLLKVKLGNMLPVIVGPLWLFSNSLFPLRQAFISHHLF